MPLEMPPDVESQLVAILEQRLGDDAGVAFYRFFRFARGGRNGNPAPRYAEVSRTIGYVRGIRGGPADIDMFDWGGSGLGLPDMRVWYLREPGAGPRAMVILVTHSDDLAADWVLVGRSVKARFGAQAVLERN